MLLSGHLAENDALAIEVHLRNRVRRREVCRGEHPAREARVLDDVGDERLQRGMGGVDRRENRETRRCCKTGSPETGQFLRAGPSPTNQSSSPARSRPRPAIPSSRWIDSR